MYAPPKAGDVITVTTRYSEGYIYADTEWRDTTYRDVTVIKGPEWKPTGSFCIPCDEPYIKFRTISMRNVHHILINGQEGKTVKEIVYRTIRVKGSKGNEYNVALENGVAVKCECTGFQFRKECRHLKEAESTEPKTVDFLQKQGENGNIKSDPRKETTMSNLKSLGWGERFAVIEALNPTDEQIEGALGIDADELATARELLASGTFTLPDSINAKPYAKVFADIAVATTEVDTTETKKPARAKSTRTRTPAVTATKVVPTPKKRGRKGTKIQVAFAAVSTTPVAAADFASTHSVSLNVLKQAKRFDRSGNAGRVRVKQINGVLSIFREAPEK